MNRSASRRNTEELWEKRVHELCTTTTITTNYYSRRCLPRKAAWTIVSHRQEHQVSTASPPGSLPYHIFPEAKQTKQNKQKTKISTNGLSCEDFLNIIISEELQQPITLSLCHFYDYCPPPSHSVWSPHTLSYGIWLFAKKLGCACVCVTRMFSLLIKQFWSNFTFVFLCFKTRKRNVIAYFCIFVTLTTLVTHLCCDTGRPHDGSIEPF